MNGTSLQTWCTDGQVLVLSTKVLYLRNSRSRGTHANVPMLKILQGLLGKCFKVASMCGKRIFKTKQPLLQSQIVNGDHVMKTYARVETCLRFSQKSYCWGCRTIFGFMLPWALSSGRCKTGWTERHLKCFREKAQGETADVWWRLKSASMRPWKHSAGMKVLGAISQSSQVQNFVQKFLSLVLHKSWILLETYKFFTLSYLTALLPVILITNYWI